MEFSNVTRVEVIVDGERIREWYGRGEVGLSEDGRVLRLVVTTFGEKEVAEVQAAEIQELRQALHPW